MGKAIAKAQVVLLSIILLAGAVGVYYVAQKELSTNNNPSTATPTSSTSPVSTPTATPTQAPVTPIPTSGMSPAPTPTTSHTSPTPSTSPNPTPTTTPTSANSSLTIVSVSLLQPYNPAGPQIEVILQNNSTNPLVSLQAVLSLSGGNYTYVFDDVSLGNPLLPYNNASQTETLIGAGFETNQTYPMEIKGTLQNGSSFDFTTFVPITQPSNQPVASGEKGNLKLTMTLSKTTFSLGEPVNFTLTITNVSGQTINFTHTGLDFDFQVTNGSNFVVYQWSNFKAIAQFIAIEPLPAGESISANFTWLQTCNFNLQVQGEPVSPGTYNIIGQTGPTYGIQTTPMQLTIIQP